MSEELVEYGRIDYPSLILIQLNRIASIRSSFSSLNTKEELQNYFSSIKVLYMLAPKAVREEVGDLPNPHSISSLDNFFTKLRDALEKHGLIARRFIEVGRPDVDVHKEST